jgi:hypothetical protein
MVPSAKCSSSTIDTSIVTCCIFSARVGEPQVYVFDVVILIDFRISAALLIFSLLGVQ